MSSIINLATKDITQIIRDRKSFLFLLIMPIAFTFMFGLVFSGPGSANKDTRVAVGILNQDVNSNASRQLVTMLDGSSVIRLVNAKDESDLQTQISNKKITASLLIPSGFGDSLAGDQPQKLVVTADTNTINGLNAQTEIGAVASRVSNAALTARVLAPNGGAEFDTVLLNSMAAWKNPPVKIVITGVKTINPTTDQSNVSESKYAHSSPGMMLQFAIAGLSTCATIIISERKNRCLQRLLTTSTDRIKILVGHFLALFVLILVQFLILIVFGELVLKVNYFNQPAATLLIALAASLCISALGLLIGVWIKSEEQATAVSLIVMFLFSGMGGAWVPLEETGKTFQAIGHITPVAWAMDGFSNIVSRNLGIQSVWLPVAALLGYAALFFLLANWKFKTE